MSVPKRALPILWLGTLLIFSYFIFGDLASREAQASEDKPLFFQDIGDLPVMPGLVEDRSAGLAFDRPEGRIIEAVASGVTDRETVISYYAAVLPSLGWTPTGTSYARGPEQLNIETETTPSGLIVRVFVKPAGG